MMDFSRHRFCKVFFKLVVVTKLIVIGGIIVKYDKRWYHLTGFGEPMYFTTRERVKFTTTWHLFRLDSTKSISPLWSYLRLMNYLGPI